jgi:hypothetical protein
MSKDIFGQTVTVGDTVAVSRQVGYSVGQYAAEVLDVFEKDGHWSVRVKYTGSGYSIPKKPTIVGISKVVVIR